MPVSDGMRVRISAFRDATGVGLRTIKRGKKTARHLQKVSRTLTQREATGIRNTRLALHQPVCLGSSSCVNWPVLGTHLCSRCSLVAAVSRAAARYGTSMSLAAERSTLRLRIR